MFRQHILGDHHRRLSCRSGVSVDPACSPLKRNSPESAADSGLRYGIARTQRLRLVGCRGCR